MADAKVAHRARIAVGRGETDRDGRLIVAIRRRSPDDARLALGAEGLLPLPVDPKLRDGLAGLRPGLLARVAPDRPEGLAGVIVSARDQVIRRGSAGVDYLSAALY